MIALTLWPVIEWMVKRIRGGEKSLGTSAT
jgi:hypothetical protein